jgi:hypothetical protein
MAVAYLKRHKATLNGYRPLKPFIEKIVNDFAAKSI